MLVTAKLPEDYKKSKLINFILKHENPVSSWYDNTGKVHNNYLPEESHVIKAGPDLYKFLHEYVPDKAAEDFSYKKPQRYTVEPSTVTEDNRGHALYVPNSPKREDVHYAVDPTSAAKEVLENILVGGSNDYSPLFGEQYFYPTILPYVTINGEKKYGPYWIQKAQAMGIKDEPRHFDEKLQKWVRDPGNPYGNISYRDVINNPYYNFNHPIWQHKTPDEIKADAAKYSYDTFITPGLKGAFDTKSLKERVGDWDWGVTPKYADYKGRLNVNEKGEPESFDYLADLFRKMRDYEDRMTTIPEDREETKELKEKMRNDYLEKMVQEYSTSDSIARHMKEASDAGDYELSNKLNSIGMMTGDDRLNALRDVILQSKEYNQFADSVKSGKKSGYNQLNIDRKAPIYNRKISPVTGLPVGQIWDAPVKSAKPIHVVTKGTGKHNQGAARFKSGQVEAGAAGLNDQYTEAYEQAMATGEVSPEVKQRMSETLRKLKSIATKNDLDFTMRKGTIDTDNLKSSGKIRQDAKMFIKNLFSPKAKPEQLEYLESKGITKDDIPAMKTYYLGAGGEGEISPYQKMGFHQLPAEQRAQKIADDWAAKVKKDIEADRKARQSSILAGLGK